MRRWFISWQRFNSPFYFVYWRLVGRALYKRVHGHDWHKATGVAPRWFS